MITSLLFVAALTALPQERATPPPCTAEIHWLNDTQFTAPRGVERPLSIFTAVSRPTGTCVPGQIEFTAVFFDDRDDVVCSGRVALTVPHQGHTQHAHLEIRPGNLYEFLRWRNGPRPASLQWSRLTCTTPDGLTEAQPADLDRARTLRLRATLLPRQNGLASAEIRMVLQP